ncbi:DISP complex protein LRCH3 isoform X3 [Hydra vulgaris]|uniref:DISP complex protein LRCH3 isoform X3 n=1 Tax=Hydra vulgaris TaxID=6087 RepID=A0ABM4B6T6_HYDVU
MSRISLERCFEDAVDKGELFIQQKNLKSFPIYVDDYDLADVTRVDISRNKFSELPQEILSFTMMEKLICSNNMLKSLPDVSHLNALSYLDISQNHLQSLPAHICSLPLKILKASYNKLTGLPTQIGLLSKLQSLDVSCNELTSLPSTMGELSSLRLLNIRRNQITALPDELSKLKNLSSLDFSCNKVSVIPPAFRLITSLTCLDLASNPLTSPPAQICLKGRLHIVKYLILAAQQQEKRWTMTSESRIQRSPSSNSLSSNNGNEKVSTLERNHDVCHLQQDDIQPRVRRATITNENLNDQDNDFVDTTLQCKTSFINSVDGNGDERNNFFFQSPNITIQQNFAKSRIDSTTLTSTPVEIGKLNNPTTEKVKSKIGTTPLTLNLSTQEPVLNEKGELTPQATTPNETFDMAHGTMSLERKNSRSQSNVELISDGIKTKQSPMLSPSDQSKLYTNTLPIATKTDVVFEGIGPRNPLISKNKNSKFLDAASSYTMRRIFDSAKEEFEQLEKLREAIETRLRIKLPDDLPASLSDGIVLCHLVNHLRKGTISVIHVPSAGVPKLTMPKCQMNVDAFLDACRKVGVERVELCSPGDILEEKSPTRLCKTVQALLVALNFSSPLQGSKTTSTV